MTEPNNSSAIVPIAQKSIICDRINSDEDNNDNDAVIYKIRFDNDDTNEGDNGFSFTTPPKQQRATKYESWIYRYPFVKVRQVYNDVILAPSRGSFLEEFANNTGLHVAIVGNDGTILEFDKLGLWKVQISSDPRWDQCLPIGYTDSLIGDNLTWRARFVASEAWTRAYDSITDAADSRWTPQEYHRDRNNCFDFVICFLEKFIMLMLEKAYCDIETDKLTDGLDLLSDKTKFCQQYIVPKTQKAARYMCLYRKLMNGETEVRL